VTLQGTMASSGSNDLDFPITTKPLLDNQNLVHPARHVDPAYHCHSFGRRRTQ
jgi:hypothetical protein